MSKLRLEALIAEQGGEGINPTAESAVEVIEMNEGENAEQSVEKSKKVLRRERKEEPPIIKSTVMAKGLQVESERLSTARTIHWSMKGPCPRCKSREVQVGYDVQPKGVMVRSNRLYKPFWIEFDRGEEKPIANGSLILVRTRNSCYTIPLVTEEPSRVPIPGFRGVQIGVKRGAMGEAGASAMPMKNGPMGGKSALETIPEVEEHEAQIEVLEQGRVDAETQTEPEKNEPVGGEVKEKPIKEVIIE